MDSTPPSDAVPSKRSFAKLAAHRLEELAREGAVLVIVFGTLESYNGDQSGPSLLRATVLLAVSTALFGAALALEWWRTDD
jgi:hypothetical protein